MQCCYLCGIGLGARRRRYQEHAPLLEFLKDRCTPTSMVYAHLAGAPPLKGKLPLCIPCVNWKRRGAHKRGYLQLDQLMLSVMQPGRFREPDQRCLGRLLDALLFPHNPLRCAFPLPVAGVLSRLGPRDRSLAGISQAWWEYNHRTAFFRHAQTARLVRGLVKQTPDEEKTLDAGEEQAVDMPETAEGISVRADTMTAP
jgi:hypothetical protein